MEKNKRFLAVIYLSVVFAIVSLILGVIIIISRNTQPPTSSVSVTLILFIIAIIITSILGVIQIFSNFRRITKNKANEQVNTIKITLEIDGEPISIEAADIESVEEVLKLAQRLQATNPSIGLKGKIPQRQSDSDPSGASSAQNVEVEEI